AFSPDGTSVVAGGLDFIRAWDTRTGAPRAFTRGKLGDILGLHFSQDGKTLTTVGDDGALRVWHASGGELLSRFETNAPGRLPQPSASQDGKLLVLGPRHVNPAAGVLRIPTSLDVWDTKAARMLYTLPDCDLTAPPALSGDGTILAAVREEDS